MKLIERKSKLRDELEAPRREGRTIGLVPTMGYLHDGHLELLAAAREACEIVVMSIFVNPAQFGPGEDLERYPRDLARDTELAEAAGVDVVFAPRTAEIYPDGFATAVIVEGLGDVLCGDPASRGAGHFRGVTTVVAKLLNIVGPDAAYFGQKDAQQAIVIGRMARDLDLPARIEVLPTVREPDGLAMSSRNAYLSAADRTRAAALSAALSAADRVAAPGTPTSEAVAAAREVLAAAGIEPEYVEARDAEHLAPTETFNGRPILLALAARIGPARLIDNVVIETAGSGGD